jgi:plastocyanin
MRAARSFAGFILFASLVGSLLAGPAQAGWRHGHGYGYGYGCGGYDYGGYAYGGYAYGGYGYGGYGYGGYWSAPMAYSRTPMYSARSYSFRPTYDSQPYATRQGGAMSYGAQTDTRLQPYGAAAAAARPTTQIDIGALDNYFQPNNITVKPGTTVRWTNRGAHGHTVTSHHNLFDSGDIQPGATYSATFTHPGTYHYYCRHHTGEAMRGAIVVQDAATTAAGQQPASASGETARRPSGTAVGASAASRY